MNRRQQECAAMAVVFALVAIANDSRFSAVLATFAVLLMLAGGLRWRTKAVDSTPLSVTRVDGAPVPPLGKGRSEHEQLRWWAGLTLDETGIEVTVAPSEPRKDWPGLYDVRMRFRSGGGSSRGPMRPAEVRAFLGGIEAASKWHAALTPPPPTPGPDTSEDPS